MIRTFVVVGIIGVAAVTYLATLGQGPEYQMAPAASLLAQFEADGVVPAANDVVENEEVEHGIFDVPAQDEVELEKAMAMGGMDMGGMKMDGMNMSGEAAGNTPRGSSGGQMAMDGMKMDGDAAKKMPMDGETKTAMPMDGMKMDSMKMDGDAAKKMPMDGETKTAMPMDGMKMDGMKMDGDAAKKMPMDGETKTAMPMDGMKMDGMKMDGDAAKKMPMDGETKTAMPMDGMKMDGMKMDGDAAKKMPMDGDAKMAMKKDGDAEPAGHGGDEDDSGLKISEKGKFDREINLTMAEWKFSDMNIEVKSGEKIRFNITNGGKIPHEFMFMTMPAMAAVNYRATRADWNLLEHEALFEKSLVLPGGKFSFVAEIKKDGAWMFMCMLPYHMQMGMMGQIATPGMAMDMNMKM